MKGAGWTSLAVIVMLMILYEWPRMKRNSRRDKAAFAVFTALGCLLAILLLTFPNMASPTQWVEHLYKPLGKLLEK